MNISHLIALDDLGGLQTLFISAAVRMQQAGYDFTVVNRAKQFPLPQFARKLSQAGVAARSPVAKSYSRLSRLAVDPTSSIAKSLGSRALRAALHTASQGPKKIVFWNTLPRADVLGRASDAVLYDHGLSSLKRPTRRGREALRLASTLITVSSANAFLLRERWGWCSPIETIMNPLRQEIADADPGGERRLPDGRTFVIGCAARLVPKKGIISAVHALGILRDRGVDVRLLIAGDGIEAERIGKKACELGLESHVHLLGPVQDMTSFFRSIDVLMAPSLREPFGLSPLEALAMGIPTILSNVDGHPEVLPFPEAATLIQPTLSLQRYSDLGAGDEEIPAFVFSPLHKNCVATKAVDPVDLANAITAILDRYEVHAATAYRAALSIRQRNSLATYISSLASAIG